MTEQELADIRMRHEQVQALLQSVENPPPNAHSDRGALLAEVDWQRAVRDLLDRQVRRWAYACGVLTSLLVFIIVRLVHGG